MARAGEESRSSRSFFPGNCRYLRDRLPGLSTRVYPDKIFLARRQALILRYENSRRASLLAEQKSPLCLSLSLYTLTLGHPHARDGRVKERERRRKRKNFFSGCKNKIRKFSGAHLLFMENCIRASYRAVPSPPPRSFWLIASRSSGKRSPFLLFASAYLNDSIYRA